jgi:endonuclease/exonuclease/phosphatase family metal-dependent hydrolase
MKKTTLLVLVFAILFLFIIQSAGTLVESIYILDLMNSNLDEKALGVLFFFTPLLALPFFKRWRRALPWILLGLLVLSRGLIPYLTTADRMLAAGIATGAAFSLLFWLICNLPHVGRPGAAGLALAVGLSALLRAAGEGIEYSLIPAGGWAGWVLGLLLLGLHLLAKPGRASTPQPKGERKTAAVLGIYLILTLVYFSFSAPAVIARWTEGDYTLIAGAVSLFSLASAWLLTSPPKLMQRIPLRGLLLWNVLFTLSLSGTLLAHRIPFPPTADSPAVVVQAPTWLQHVPLGLMLLLFPVLFVDLLLFLQHLQPHAPIPGPKAKRSPAPEGKASGGIGAGILVGTFAMVILIFVNIFSNVWGYIEPVSPLFRNTFWLAFFLLSGGTSLLAWLVGRGKQALREPVTPLPWAGVTVPALLFLATAFFAFPSERVGVADSGSSSLRAMTFNTQQSNDDFGEKSVEAQLALIRQVSPDILALQESDSARISLNNNDYVRYFAEKLGYYSYYGPTPGTGTFGTAILSKYPLQNVRSVFIFSDKDETGVAEAEVEVNGMRFTIYDVHPDSSDQAMLVFARTLVDRAADKAYVIALGDYNLRDYEAAYQLIDDNLVNAWVSVYPSEIGADGVDMSGENRIDHIFLSANLQALDPTYILPPESATDHPVHWTDIVWSEP